MGEGVGGAEDEVGGGGRGGGGMAVREAALRHSRWAQPGRPAQGLIFRPCVSVYPCKCVIICICAR